MKLTPQQRAEYKVRLRAMTPKQLAEHKARLKALSCEIVEDATRYATLFLWCQGIRVTRDAPASLRRIALEREIDLSDATYPPKSIGADPAFDEFIRKFHEKLIDCVLLGWRGAGDILCDFADRLMTEGEPLPPWLGKYLVWAARGDGEALRKGRRGQDPYGNVNRDFAIATAVRLISDLSGLNPTRGEATAYAEKAESGCSVVAKALKDLGVPRMSEKNVVAIWGPSKKGRSPFALVDHALARQVLDKRRQTRQESADVASRRVGVTQ